MIMSRILSIIIISVGGYYLFQKRFRVLNVILGNTIIRRFFVSSLMSIPAIKNRMMSNVFSQNSYPV
jgi:uncharacterized protein YneF (UPF0154 family)